jgi:hypothetical protein
VAPLSAYFLCIVSIAILVCRDSGGRLQRTSEILDWDGWVVSMVEMSNDSDVR